MCPVDPSVDGDSCRAPTDSVREIRVTFDQLWSYAYCGIEVVRFEKGDVADISEKCFACATENGVKFKKTPDVAETTQEKKDKIAAKAAKEAERRRNHSMAVGS